jgi:hypothetical protein
MKQDKYTKDIYEVVTSLFDEEGENFKYNLQNIDWNDFFTGFLLAYANLFRKITQENIDLLDVIAAQNKLAVQYLLDSQEQELANYNDGEDNDN